PDETRSLFERFKQGHQGHRSSSKGFGLGLNIVRDLVAINLGCVAVRSEVGKGSTFSFTLPADDPGSIVKCCLERVAERNSSALISALRVTRESAVENIDGLQKFLASVVHSNDLQLHAPDGHALYLIGECSVPDRWRDRIIDQYS